MPTSNKISSKSSPQRNPSRQSKITLDRRTTSQHICPCCSYVLLRHIRLNGVYWRCSHCHAEMPVWYNL